MVNWNFEQGFPHKKTTAILKDVNGFLWIGTETGLSRFDGNVFKNYFPIANKSQNIPTGVIWGLTEDSLHNIWIGSDKGLWRYDNTADSFTHFLPYDTSGYATAYIIPFWATESELLCAEADTMITAYNIHTFAKRRVVYLHHKIANNSTVQFSVYEPRTSTVWMLLNIEGLYSVSLKNGSMEAYGCNGSEGLCYDRKRNSLWLNTEQGLMRFDLGSRKFQHIDDANEIFSRGVAIHLDNSDRIWVCTHDDVFSYDPDSRLVNAPFSKNKVLHENICWANYRMYCDRDGMVWIGYYTQAGKGITQLTPVTFVTRRYSSDTSQADGFHVGSGKWSKTDDGQIWLCGDYTIDVFNPGTDIVRHIKSSQLSGIDKTKRISFLNVNTTAQKAWLWIDGSPSLYEADLATLQCKPLTITDTAGRVLTAVTPSDFVLAHFKLGLLFLRGKPGEGDHQIYQINPDATCRQLMDFGNKRITNIATDGEKILFVRFDGALFNKTYSLVDGKWIPAVNPIDSLPWIEIGYDRSDQTWWVGSFRQITHYDKNFKLIKRYSQDDGVPDLYVYSIMPDNKGNIWFNGSSGYISQLNTISGTITTLSEKDGYTKRFFYPVSAVLKDNNGDIYFAGYGIIDRISPDKYLSVPSSVYLKSLNIKEFQLPTSIGVNNLQKLTFKYFQNRINIETGTIDYYSQGKNHIRYKLEGEGRQEAWQYAPANYTIRYEELPPGKYTLQIQASNAGNEFTGPIKALLFQINPAFWNTWWFRITAAIFILSVFYLLIRYRTRQRFSLQLERSEKDKQMAELQQQKIEMEMQALRAQMNPHFIFNSLNSINRFILQNNRAQASEYLTKFSKLVRMILQNSQASLISLESELESLNLYLDLEAVRFEHKFDYKISYPKDLDIEVLKVPPLIIQPYTENAIWHGLMHKEEKGQLDIDVSQEDDYLYLKITDNGIGRKKASELASKSATKHKSMGLRITKDRIAMLEKTNGGESPVKIIDLENEDGSAAGTEVIIKMPVIDKTM